MKHQWHFNERRACDRMRDSANKTFFTAESLENLREVLVQPESTSEESYCAEVQRAGLTAEGRSALLTIEGEIA